MVDSTVFECGLCTYPFDELAHRPLSMPCGHVFCQQCLIHYYNGEALVCPLDFSTHPTDPYSLPSCYGILSHLPSKQNLFSCPRHASKKVKFLCKLHQIVLCSECVLDHTGAGHALTSLDVDLQQVKTDLSRALCQSRHHLDLVTSALAQLETSERQFCAFNDEQLFKLNCAYDQALRTLQRNKKEAAAALARQWTEQLKVFEVQKHKLKLAKDAQSKLSADLGDLMTSFKRKEYGTVLARFHIEDCTFVEKEVEPVQVQYWGYKEHIHISVGGMVRLFERESRLLGRTKTLKENTGTRATRSPGTKPHDRVLKCRLKGTLRRHMTRKRTHSL